MWCIALICFMTYVISDQSLTVATDAPQTDQVTISYKPSTIFTDETEYESTTITYPMTQTTANVNDKITTMHSLKSEQTKMVEHSMADTTPPTTFAPTTPIPVDACDTEYLEVTNTPVQVQAFTRNTNCNLLVTVPDNTAIVIRLIHSSLNDTDISTYFYTESIGNLPKNCKDRYVLVSVDHTPCAVIIGGNQLRFHFQNIDMLVEVYTMDVQISTCFDPHVPAPGQVQCELKSYAKLTQIYMYCSDCICDYLCTCTLGYREWVSTCIDGKDSNTTTTYFIVYKPVN